MIIHIPGDGTLPGVAIKADSPSYRLINTDDGIQHLIQNISDEVRFLKSIGGTERVPTLSNQFTLDWSDGNIKWRSTTIFYGILNHANTAERTYTFPDASGTVLLTATASGLFTEGSVPFADAAGLLTQDNTNFFWNDGTDTLLIENLDVNDHAAFGSLASVSTGITINIDDALSNISDATIVRVAGFFDPSSGSASLKRGILSAPEWRGTGTSLLGELIGHESTPIQRSTLALTTLTGFSTTPSIFVASTVTDVFGYRAKSPVFSFAVPTNSTGVEIQNYGAIGVAESYGIRILAQSGSTLTRAIASEGGDSHHVGDFRFGSTVDPTVTVDITGSLTVSDDVILGNDAATDTIAMVGMVTTDIVFSGNFGDKIIRVDDAILAKDLTIQSGGTVGGPAGDLILLPATGGTGGLGDGGSLLVDGGIAGGGVAGDILIAGNQGKVSFFGATPQAQDTGWTLTNVTEDKVLDADSTSLNEVADFAATIAQKLIDIGIFST